VFHASIYGTKLADSHGSRNKISKFPDGSFFFFVLLQKSIVLPKFFNFVKQIMDARINGIATKQLLPIGCFCSTGKIRGNSPPAEIAGGFSVDFTG